MCAEGDLHIKCLHTQDFPTRLHISRFGWIYFWLFSSPVCSCSLLHCFVYIADEPQHLNCDASVKDWVEHVKINNNTPISLLFSKPAFLRGPSLWGPPSENHMSLPPMWPPPLCLFLSLKTHTHAEACVSLSLCLVLLHPVFLPHLSFAPLKWPFSANVISTGKEGQLITHSILIG